MSSPALTWSDCTDLSDSQIFRAHGVTICVRWAYYRGQPVLGVWCRSRYDEPPDRILRGPVDWACELGGFGASHRGVIFSFLGEYLRRSHRKLPEDVREALAVLDLESTQKEGVSDGL